MSKNGFGASLRTERERRQIALSSICANTKIKVSLFEGLERDDVSKWPSGIFRRAFIRAYAEGIGLDPEVVTREFLEHFPDPIDVPLVSAAPIPTTARHVEMPDDTAIRLTLADPGAPFAKGRLLANMRQRWAAVACDAGVVVALAGIVFLASGKFWLPLGVSMLCYYLGGILLLGNTPGVCLWAPGAGRPSPAVTTITAKGTGLKTALALLARLHRSASVPHEGTSRP